MKTVREVVLDIYHNPEKYRKLIAGFVGSTANAISAGLISGSPAHYISIAIGLLTLYGIYKLPNDHPAA